MAILNYGNQFKYSGKGYVDSKMSPVRTFDDLETNVGVLSSLYAPGMKVTVLNDGDFGVVDYYLSEQYEWKRLINFDNISLSLDKGEFDSDDTEDIYLQLNYTNPDGTVVALGQPVDMSVIFSDFKDENKYISSASFVTEHESEKGLYIKFSYNDSTDFFLDVTELTPNVYQKGLGVLIGEGNVISIDEAWFDEWFNTKISNISSKIDKVEEDVISIKATVTSLSEQLNKIKGVDSIKAGKNIDIVKSEDGIVTISSMMEVSAQEGNAIQKLDDGIYVRDIEIFYDDDEINAVENN